MCENHGMRPAAPPSLGSALERRRLEHRVRRAKLVLAALEDRTMLHSREDGIPPALTEAVREFSSDLGRLSRRLTEPRRHEP
jgi:hypothetical protein